MSDALYGSLMANDQYLRELRWMERATDEQEQAWIECVARVRLERGKSEPDQRLLQGGQHARNRLIEVYQPVVVGVARRVLRLCNGWMELLDLVSEGTIGLIHVVDQCEVPNVYAFRALVVKSVHGSMLSAIRDHGGLVRLPWRARAAVNAFIHARDELFQSLGYEPSYAQIAERLQVSITKVSELAEYADVSRVQSLQAFFEDNEDADEFLQPITASLYEAVSSSSAHSKIVSQALERLPDRQREVVRLRFGFDSEEQVTRSLKDVGDLVGSNAAAVTANLTKAKQRLREYLAVLSSPVAA